MFFQGTFGGVAGCVRGSPITAVFNKGQLVENNAMSGPAMIRVTQADIDSLLGFAREVRFWALQHSQARTRVDSIALR